MPPPRLAASPLPLLLMLAIAPALLSAGAAADDAQVGTVADDGLLEETASETPSFNWRRRPSRRRLSSPVVVGPVDNSAVTSQPPADVDDSQGTTSSAPPSRRSRTRSRASRRNSRNRTSSYVPVSRTPQHHYALRGNHEPRSTTESGLTSPLIFSSATDSILTQATTEDYEHVINHETVPSSVIAELAAARNTANENQQFSEVFKKRPTESPLSVDLSVAIRSPEPTEGGQTHIAKSNQRGSVSSGATASGFDSRRTIPRAAGVRSLFGKRFKHQSTLQPEQYRSRSTSLFPSTAEVPLTQTVQLDGHTRATREYEAPETTTPQADARTPSGRRRLVSVARRRRPIDTTTAPTVSPTKDEESHRPAVRVQKRRRPPIIDTTTESAVSTTEARGSIRKTKLYKKRRPISTGIVTTEPSILDDDSLGNQRGYRRVRPSSPQQEPTSQQDNTINGEKYQFSVQRSSKSEETVVGGRRKPGGRVRGRRPLLRHSEPDVTSSEKPVGGGTIATTTTEILPEAASVVPEVSEPPATPSTSTTTEASTRRRVLARSRRPVSGFRRAVTPSIAPLIQAEPVSRNPSGLLEESSTAVSLTTHTPTENTPTEQTTAGSTNLATTSARNLPSTQVTNDTILENEGGLTKKISPKFRGAKGRLPGRRVRIGSKYSTEQRNTTPEASELGQTSEKIRPSTLNATAEKPTGHISDRFVKSRTLNSLRNRKPTSLLRGNKRSNVTEAPTTTVEEENLVALDGESTTSSKTSVMDSYITTESPESSTVKDKGRLQKIKLPLTPRKTKAPPKLPVFKKIPSNSTEDETNKTSVVPDTGTRLKERKTTSLDKLLKMRRPLPGLLRKSQNELASPAPDIAGTNNNSETTSANSTISTQADVTPGQTTAEEFDTTTAAVATSPLQTNTDSGESNSIRKLPKGFRPSRLRLTISEARKTRIKDTPELGVRDRPRFIPSSTMKKGGRVNISAVNGTQPTAPLKIGLLNNRKPFTGFRSPFLKSTSRLNKKPANSEHGDTETPTDSVKETTEAYSVSPKVVDNVIEDFGSDTTSKVDDEVQEMISNRPIVTTEKIVAFEPQNTTLGNGVEETADPLVNPTLSPMEESGSTTRKTFTFPSTRGRGSEKHSKLKSLQKLLSMFRQKSNNGVVSTTEKFDTETHHPTPEVPSILPPDHQNTISETEKPLLEGDNLRIIHTTEESALTAIMEATVVPVVLEEKLIPSEISNNYGNTSLPLSMTTDSTTLSTPEKSESEDSPTVATIIFEAETETMFPETTTVSGERLVLEGSDSLDNGNTIMKHLNMSGEFVKTDEHSISLQTGVQLEDNPSYFYGNNVGAETTESSLSVTERPDEILSTLESSTEVQAQPTTMVYEQTVTVTEPLSTFHMATQSVESTVSKVWTEPRNVVTTEANERSVPESDSPIISLTDVVLHNLTEAISQLSNEIDSVYTDINVTSEFKSVTTPQNTTDLSDITEQAIDASLELNTSNPPDIEDTVLTTESSITARPMNAEIAPQQFNTTYKITSHGNTVDSGTTTRTTAENAHSIAVEDIELSTVSVGVQEETTLPSADSVNAETVTQQFNATSETTTNASIEDARATIENTVENTYNAVVAETKFPAATSAVPKETTTPSGLNLEESITDTERYKIFTESVPTDKSSASTEIPDFWTSVLSGSVTETYKTMETQTDRPNSKTTEGNISGDSSVPTTEENRNNSGIFVDKSPIGISEEQSELDSSTRTVTTVEFRRAVTTTGEGISTTAITSEEQRDNSGYTHPSTTENLEPNKNDVYRVTENSDTLNNGGNSSKIKGKQKESLRSTSEEEQENLITESSDSNNFTETTVYQSQQPVTNMAVTEQVTERETLEPSTPTTSNFSDSAISDSNSVLDYKMVTDPVTVITELFAAESWVTTEDALSTMIQTNTPKENDLKANEIKFNDSLYHLPTSQVEEITLPPRRLTQVNTDSADASTTESYFYATSPSMNSSEEMPSYSSLPDTASTENALSEDRDNPSYEDTSSSIFTDSAVTTISFSTDHGNPVPEKTTSFTDFGDELTTERRSVNDDSIQHENYASSGPFPDQTVTPHSSVLDEDAHSYTEITMPPVADPLLISMINEDDQNETVSATTGRTTVDDDTTFSPTVTVAFPLSLETADGVVNAAIHFSNTKQTSREDDDMVRYQNTERNSVYTDVSAPIFADTVQPSTPLPPSNCTGQWMGIAENNCTVKQDVATGFSDASFLDKDTAQAQSSDSEGNSHHVLLTGVATESHTEDGVSTYWTESFESQATDSLVTREDESLTSDTNEIRESSFSDSSTDYTIADSENGNERFAALDVHTIAPS